MHVDGTRLHVDVPAPDMIEKLLARADCLTCAQIAAIPDGDYALEDGLDDDGVNIGQPVSGGLRRRAHGEWGR